MRQVLSAAANRGAFVGNVNNYNGTCGLVGVNSGTVNSSYATVTVNSSDSSNYFYNVVIYPNDSLSGSAASNYSITQPTGLTGNIVAPVYVAPPVSSTSHGSTSAAVMSTA